jgi:hypothetical protein
VSAVTRDRIDSGYSDERQERANRNDALVKLRQLARLENTAEMIEQAEANGLPETTLEALRRDRWRRNYMDVVGVSFEERHELRREVERIAETGDSPVFMAIQSARERFRNGLEACEDGGWTSADLRAGG